MTVRRHFVIAGAAAAAGIGPARSSRAESAIEMAKILVGFPPGATSDALARRIADKLQGSYASNVIVENRPGAGAQIAVVVLRDSPADGSVLLLTPSSMLSIYPYVYSKLGYRPERDVAPVSVACFVNHGFGIGPAVPESVRSFGEFIAWAKAHPDQANYGSPGAGSMAHLVAALAGKLSGTDLRHIPYRGSAPGITDLLGGQISAMSSPVGDYLPYMKGGKLRLLAVSGDKRSPFAPTTPTYTEQGYAITVREWYGIFLPGRATPQVQRRAAAIVHAALAQPDLVAGAAQMGMEIEASSPDALAQMMRGDAAQWRGLIRQIGFTAES